MTITVDWLSETCQLGLSAIDIRNIVFPELMNQRQKISPYAGLAITALDLTLLIGGSSQLGKYFPQNVSSNQMTNQTALNQTASQAANQTLSNQNATSEPKLRTSDVKDIRKSLDDIKNAMDEGKAIEALKTTNLVDDRLLVAISANPLPLLASW